MSALELAPRVLAGTPPWVWAILILLIVLGVRRLRPRRTHLAVAALAPAGFMLWSLTGVAAAAGDGHAAPVLAVWAVALLLGGMSVFVHQGPERIPQGGGVFLFRGSAIPLVVYLLVFAARYGLGVWSAFQPELAGELTLAAVAISAATAGRFIADFAPLLRRLGATDGFAVEAERTN